jgi:hypothetical protein
MSMKNSNDTFGNRTRDLPAFSAVPQATAPLEAQRTLSEKLMFCRYGIAKLKTGKRGQRTADWEKSIKNTLECVI